MLHTRLKQLRTEKDLTQAALARELNVTQQAVAKWESGKSMPDHSMLLRLSRYYGVSVDYLLGLPASMPGDGFAGPVLVPVVGAVRAGYNAFAFEEHLGSEPAGIRSPEGYFYLVVRGDSMEPYIHDGDLALVRRQRGALQQQKQGEHKSQKLAAFHTAFLLLFMLSFSLYAILPKFEEITT